MSLPLPKAQLIGVFLECFSYGLYTMVFLDCMKVLRKRQSPSDYLVRTAVSLFIFVTAHFVVDIERTVVAFTSNLETPGFVVTYYNTWDTWENLARNSLYVAVTVISDAFIMYRTFIVWGRNYYIVIIPFLLFLADITIGILWVYSITLISNGSDIFTNALATRMKVFYSITLGMNVTCTCLIAYKIWSIQKTVAPYAKGKRNEMSRVVSIIVESASIYSAFLVVMIATYSVNSTSMFIFLNAITPIIGIVFSSVIVRVGSGISHGDTRDLRSQGSSRLQLSGARQSKRQPTAEGQFSPGVVGSFPDRGIQVEFSQTVHTRIDDGLAEEVRADLESPTIEVKSEGLGVV